MFPAFNIRLVLLLPLLFITIRGCRQSGDQQLPESRQARAEVNLQRQDSTQYYTYDIRLPEIIRTNRTLRDTLTVLADNELTDFLSHANRDTMPETAAYPWELLLHVTVEDSTRHFISLLGEGYTFTGGAHGMPFFITLSYDQERQQFIELPEMLGDSTALEPISEYVRRELAQQLMSARQQPVQGNTSVEQYINDDTWLRDGTAPRYAKYKNVMLRPQGLRIIFGAYQVGPYAIGTPKVDVPVSVFREELKAKYKKWFVEYN